MKKMLATMLALAMVVGLVSGCSKAPASDTTPAGETETSDDEAAAEEGKVFNIYAWNEEFKGFFEKYYEVPEGVTVNWIINPSNDGVYQDKLDEALLNQENAPADEKVDLFLAEADYILNIRTLRLLRM